MKSRKINTRLGQISKVAIKLMSNLGPKLKFCSNIFVLILICLYYINSVCLIKIHCGDMMEYEAELRRKRRSLSNDAGEDSPAGNSTG